MTLRKRLRVFTLAAALLAVCACQSPDRSHAELDEMQAGFVGRSQCVDCHADAYNDWRGSHHDDAMDVATAETVLADFEDTEFLHNGIETRFYRKDGKFYVFTESTAGEMAEHEVLYTFGVEPLQQYLVAFPGGRLQALPIAWDVPRKEWFHLYPDTEIAADNWLHWTRNGQNWNGMCADCHSTNLRKNYRHETDTYATKWSEIDVSCEACHGPGSRHVAWSAIDEGKRPEIADYGLEVRSSGLDNEQFVELCAACHSRRGEVGDYDHSQVNMMETLVPSLLQQGLYHSDGQILDEVSVWGSFLQSKMYANGVSCRDCHNSHSLELKFEGNALCQQCHIPEQFDTPEHHFHEPMVNGEPGAGAQCVNCHMPEQPYMVIDYRADHSLRVPRPDLTKSIGSPNACSECHSDRDIDWVLEAYEDWYGPERKPHYGEVLARAWQADPTAREDIHALVENGEVAAIVRATALNALQAYADGRSQDLLQQALKDEEALIRHTAIDVIHAPEPQQIAELLAPLLADESRAVRQRSAARLATIGPEYLTAEQRVAMNEQLEDYVQSMRGALDFAATGLNLGNLYAAQGDSRLAEDYFRKAIDIDDLFFPAKMNLALLVAQQGNESEAELLFREVLESYPDQHEAAYSLALLLAGQNRLDESAGYLAQATTGMPANARAHYNYGLLLAQLGRDDEAEASLQAALDIEPRSFDYLYALADFYLKRSRAEEALELADRIIQAHPQQRFGYDLKAAIERGNN